VIFEDFPYRGAFKIKTGAQVMFVKNDLSMDNYFNGKMGVIKSLSSQEILVHFPEEDKTIELKNTNGRIFDIKLILQQRK
jgi:ATP-dependent exoDNAse (exonuclease V) alpha subunit